MPKIPKDEISENELLEAFFKLFSTVRVKLPKNQGNLYECFVYLETCKAAKKEKYCVDLIRGVDELFHFRASPGRLRESGHASKFGYASLISRRGRGKRYQLHMGIQLEGHSGMDHEADILLLSEAHILLLSEENHRVTVQTTPPVLTIECKFYREAKLKGEAREAVGMVTDWAQHSLRERAAWLRRESGCAQESHPSQEALPKTSSSSEPQRGCVHCGKKFEAIFATCVGQGLRPDIETYLTTYDVTPCFGVFPEALGMPSFQSTLETVFKKLKNLP